MWAQIQGQVHSYGEVRPVSLTMDFSSATFFCEGRGIEWDEKSDWSGDHDGAREAQVLDDGPQNYAGEGD